MALKGTEFKRGRNFISEMLDGHVTGALKDEKIESIEMVVEFQAEARELHPCREMEPVICVLA